MEVESSQHPDARKLGSRVAHDLFPAEQEARKLAVSFNLLGNSGQEPDLTLDFEDASESVRDLMPRTCS